MRWNGLAIGDALTLEKSRLNKDSELLPFGPETAHPNPWLGTGSEVFGDCSRSPISAEMTARASVATRTCSVTPRSTTHLGSRHDNNSWHRVFGRPGPLLKTTSPNAASLNRRQ